MGKTTCKTMTKTTMTIKEFANELIVTLHQRFPELFKNARFDIHTVPKQGGICLTGITVRMKDSQIAPCYYIDEQYNKVMAGMPFSMAVSDLADTIRKYATVVPDFDVTELCEFGKVKDIIVPKLMDGRLGKNDAYLEDKVRSRIPGTDLIVIYLIDLSKDETRSMTIPVTLPLFEQWSISLEELHLAAINNGSRLKPPYIADLPSVLMGTDPLPLEDLSTSAPMLILTSESKEHGASVILYPGLVPMLLDYFPQGIWLLPSSIHEWILLQKSFFDNPADLKEMVTTINTSYVVPEDRLSDNVYTLDKEGNLVTVMVDTTVIE